MKIDIRWTYNGMADIHVEDGNTRMNVGFMDKRERSQFKAVLQEAIDDITDKDEQ